MKGSTKTGPLETGRSLNWDAGYLPSRAAYSAVFVFFLLVGSGLAIQKTTTSNQPAWSMNATIIEACSCPMFCQCYFNTKPAEHMGAHSEHGGGKHFCKFNNAFRVNKGSYGTTKLDGAKFWIAGDLGGDFSKGMMDWAVLTFDPAVTKAQREGILAVVPRVYQVKWNSFEVAADSPMDWKYTKERAEARLAGGKKAEVVLNKWAGMTGEPVVIQNLKYWSAPRNDGFVMMPNEVEAYRVGKNAFEHKGTNGFMITIDINSTDK